jgi:signal transduction histidine kinase/ActR/RegA family two-component response regulator
MIPQDQSEDLPVELVKNSRFLPSVLQQAKITERSRSARRESEGHASHVLLAKKWETVGTLVEGITHELNDILTPIIGYTQMALEEGPATESLTDKLTQVLTAAQRAKKLLELLFSFSSQGQERKRVPIDVSLTVKKAITLLKKSLPKTISMRQDIEDCFALADAAQIHQLVENLFINAVEAMDNKGTIHISLSKVYLNERSDLLPDTLKLNNGGYVKLSVSDTGCGIDDLIIERIFDPYFTTNKSKGFGLGLAVVHGIVKRHEGAVSVQSKDGKGTTLDVYIPGIDAGDERKHNERLGSPKNTQQILLIDDEEMVVDVTGIILQAQGYRVITKTCPREALDEFRSRPREIDLIMTDYAMPLMTGAELARQILRIRPDVPIILFTGYNEAMTEARARDLGFRKLAAKPLGRTDLINLVRGVLDENVHGCGVGTIGRRP